MNLTLHAMPDDFLLNANSDLERSTGISYPYEYFLTDPDGNFLIDPDGNFLTAYFEDTLYPQVLHTISDDFALNTE